jgi:hypothetical protein
LKIQDGGSTGQKSYSDIGKNHVFCILRRPILFPIPLNHLFLGRTNWCESFGCIFVLISTIYNLEFDRARMGKDEKGAKLPAWFLFLYIPSVLKVFYQFFSSNVIYIYNYSKSYYCLFCSFIAISTKIQYFHLKILGHSILKNLFFYRKECLESRPELCAE